MRNRKIEIATKELELPRFVLDLLSAPPTRGEGLNTWLFRAARVLHHRRQPGEIIELLRAIVAGEIIKPGEIERAVDRSASCGWRPGGDKMQLRPGPWPKVNKEQREAIIGTGRVLADLWEASPTKCDEDGPTCERIIDDLFPANSLLCVGKSSSEFVTRPREALRGHLDKMRLIVPSPMSAMTGLTQDGKESEHTLKNTGQRRFLVIEQDNGDSDSQAAVLLHLAERAPLALALHSGSKSLHGWFYCQNCSENMLRRFMAYSVSLGADKATWSRSQFVRIPEGTRENGRRQTAFYLNPEVVEK
jgi:hypothetical protein